MPKRVDITAAATAVELVESQGMSMNAAGKAVGIHGTTVKAILDGARGWDSVIETSLFKARRAEQNKALEQSARTLAAKAYAHAESKLPEASFYQAVVAGSILIDKSRLLAGESTENIQHLHAVDVDKLDELTTLLREVSTLRTGQHTISGSVDSQQDSIVTEAEIVNTLNVDVPTIDT
jgi:hypothetical protein